MTNIKSLDGIGKMASFRMNQNGLGTVEAFSDYILSHTYKELQALVYLISVNLRADKCLEGYYPRKHNKRIMDGMIGYIKTIKPDFNMPDYKTIRAPQNKINMDVIDCNTHTIKPFVPYNDDDVFSRGTMEREGVAYRAKGGPETQYRYGKSCVPNKSLTSAQRDELIRTNPVYNNRRYYKCECFKEQETCEDFVLERGNRIMSKKKIRKPTVHYCKWNGVCVNL
jgi:hypothetical protein